MAASFQLTSESSPSLNLDNLSFDFPQPLTEKYRPRKISDFAGLDLESGVGCGMPDEIVVIKGAP